MPLQIADLAFVALAASPFPGLLAAIPFAVFSLGYPAWLILLLGIPLCYGQVVLVDAGWSRLEGWPSVRARIERLRSPRVARLLAAPGAFLPTALATPIIGPWAVMALMRYASVPQRRVAAPILAGITTFAVALTAACTLAPEAVRAWQGR